MIILVTGSRYWYDFKKLTAVVEHCYDVAGECGEELVVRHGACRSGADNLAKGVVYKLKNMGLKGIEEDPMPAEWQHRGCRHPKGHRQDGSWYCKLAGPIRNQRMIDKGGIFEVEAFPLPGGTGTADCVRRALRAGLDVVNHGEPKVTLQDMLYVPEWMTT